LDRNRQEDVLVNATTVEENNEEDKIDVMESQDLVQECGENATAIEENYEEENTDFIDSQDVVEEEKSASESSSKYKLILTAVVIIFLGIGLGVFFWVRKVHSQNAQKSLPPTIELLYDSPSEEDCIAISRNETINGQEDLEPVKFSISFDVTLSNDGGMTDALVQQLLNGIQERFIPFLVGCQESIGRRYLVEQKQPIIQGTHQTRHLQIEASRRYVILNAFVKKGKGGVESVCQDGSPPFLESCYNVLVDLSIFAQGQIGTLETYNLIYNGAKSGANIRNALGLKSPFEEVKMTDDVRRLTPTQAPLAMSSISPSFVPSLLPSGWTNASTNNSTNHCTHGGENTSSISTIN